jgi:hypothetical protein
MASPRACQHLNRLQLGLPRRGETGPGLEPCGRRRPRFQGSVLERTHLHSIRRRWAVPGAGCPNRRPAQSRLPRIIAGGSSTTPPQAHRLYSPQTQSHSPLEDIADLLDSLPTSACLELTHCLLSAASSFPTGEIRPRGVLKTVILFLAEHGGAA